MVKQRSTATAVVGNAPFADIIGCCFVARFVCQVLHCNQSYHRGPLLLWALQRFVLGDPVGPAAVSLQQMKVNLVKYLANNREIWPLYSYSTPGRSSDRALPSHRLELVFTTTTTTGYY